VSTEELRTCDTTTSTVDVTVVCAAYTQTETRYVMITNQIIEDYKLGILKCWYLQSVFVFPLICSHNVEATRTMCTVHMQVFCHSWVSLYKLVVLEYVTAHVEF
jgi:hypothetical protein